MPTSRFTIRRPAASGASPAALARAVEPRFARLAPSERIELEAVLWEDVASEYDARFLSRELAARRPLWGAPLRAAERHWAREERDHHNGFRAVFEAGFGATRDVDAELAARAPDFTPFLELLDDEFALACLWAYDEFATVRVYRHYLPLYARLGPEFVAFVHGVIADEARHYASFLEVARQHFPERHADLPAVLERIRAVEGQPYAATFLLDHDDPVFSARLLASAERALLEHVPSA